MDDIYPTELLRQNLTSALEREDNLKQALQAASTEMQSLQAHVLEHKKKYQQIDDLLEAEEAKTNAERLARQKAESTTRQHRAEALKLKRNEATANRHCEAAESEIISLQRDLSTERSAAVTASTLSTRLREDLRQAEANGMAAYDMLNDARAKISALEADLRVATELISMLGLRASEFEEIAQEEHLRASEAENTLNATAPEIKNPELKLSDLLEKYAALEAEHSKCHPASSVPVTSANTASKADKTHPPISIHERDPISSIRSINIAKTKHETTPAITPTSHTAAQYQTLNPPHNPPPNLPTFPSPAILRPRLASVTACQVEAEIFKASRKIVPVPTAGNTKNLQWKFFWRLPGNLLWGLIRDSGWR